MDRPSLITDKSYDAGHSIPQTVRYLYDVMGRRVAYFYTGQDSGWEDFMVIYDGVTPIEERYFDGSLKRRFYYEEGINKLARVEYGDGAAYIPLTDDRGTVMGVVDVTPGSATEGQVVEKLYYNSTGLCKSFDGSDQPITDPTTGFNVGRSVLIPFGWCGMYRDEFTGKYHTHFREYDPIHGRWLSEDPAGYRDGLSLYNAYMGVNGIDPLGLDGNKCEVYEGYLTSIYNPTTKHFDIYYQGPDKSYSAGMGSVGFEKRDAVKIGYIDPATGWLKMPCLRDGKGKYRKPYYATMKSAQNYAASIKLIDWDDFKISKGFGRTSAETQRMYNIGSISGGAVIKWQHGLEITGKDNPYAGPDEIFAIMDLTTDLAKELMWAYATLPAGVVTDRVLSSMRYVDDVEYLCKGPKVASKTCSSAKQFTINGKKLITYNGPTQKTVKNHIFNVFRGRSPKSQKYRNFFKKHNINIDDYIVKMPENYHNRWIHKEGRNWTTTWKKWIDANPNATTLEVYQQAGRMMDEANISHLRIVKLK